MPTIEEHGWTLVSAEQRRQEHPNFTLPSSEDRSAVVPGDGVQLLFDIETSEQGRVVDRGIDRMWVIVQARREGRFQGILVSDPGTADGLELRIGQTVSFGPEHIVDIRRPPAEYLARVLATELEATDDP